MRVLARVVAWLILVCAIERTAALSRASLKALRAAGSVRALFRTGLRRHLTNAHGAYDLAVIARTCANPEAAIADMIAALEAGLTRRNAIAPCAACEPLRTQTRARALTRDTS